MIRGFALSLLLATPAAAQDSAQALARAALAQLDGRISLPGLRDSVEVIRDRWGVPHIFARNTHDLFFAQGFVQAQDRLWQMDLYRRTWTGRLAELFGPEYLTHDRLVRLLGYRGGWDEAEWQSYHPEGRAIFAAFADGVNAFIAQAGDKLPVEFRLTGLTPGRWTPEIALLRTQTAFPIGDARAELTLAQSVARLGAAEANRRARPSPYRDLVPAPGVELGRISESVVDALRGLRDGMPRVAPRADPAQNGPPGSNNWVLGGKLTASGKVLVANDPHRNVGNPSIRYIVHLNAPGWDVIGATEAVLPGVMIGHNGRIAWGLTIVGTDQSDVYVEEVNPANRNEVRFRGSWEPVRVIVDTIRVKGAAAVVARYKYTRHGPIFYEDTVAHRAYAIRSTMHERGTAGYLGALRYHALGDCREFLAAQVYYKAPTENMICGDTQGNIAWQASAASPKRPNWHGRLPVPGTGEYEWDGLRSDLPRELNPERGWIATANHDIHPKGYDPPLFFKNGPQTARYDRIASLLTAGSRFTLDDMKRMQHDAYNAAAARDAALFKGWTAADPAVERARALLAAWDGWQRKESAAAALYGYVVRGSSGGPGAGGGGGGGGIPAAARDSATPAAQRQELLTVALRRGLVALVEAQGPDETAWRWGRFNRSELPHSVLQAYDIPPVERVGGAGTVAASGATYRQLIDFANLDGSLATNFPGQSGQPGSPFYANLAEPFGRGEYFPLSFTRAAVERNAAHRLLLLPRH